VNPIRLLASKSRRLPLAALGLAVMAAAVGMAGCASSLPFRYYTLLDTAPPPHNGANPPVLISVQAPTVPSQVARPQLVLTEGAGQIAIREQERWSQPLAAELQQALSQDLTRVLPAVDVARSAHAASAPVYLVGLDVQRFETTAHNGVTLDVVWSVTNSRGGVPVVCRAVQHQTPVGLVTETPLPDYAALVNAQRQALWQVSQRIAATIRAEQDNQSAPCP